MNEIELSVKRDGFRGDSPDPLLGLDEFKSARLQALERDLNQCQFCDFVAPKYQEVHHINGDHDNNALDNLVTSCSLCHMCFHIGYAGVHNRGVLIYFEEGASIPNFQARLNNLVRILWMCTSSDNKKLSIQATDYLKRLESLRIPASDYIGTSDPVFLSNYLQELSDEEYAKRKDSLEGIYLLPLKDGYPDQIRYWKSIFKKNQSISSINEIAKMNAAEWVGVSGKDRTMEGIKEFLEENEGIS